MAILPSESLAQVLHRVSGDNAYLCYQCQRCSSGCPTAASMAITPAQMMRMAQFGLEGRLLSDASIWRCLGCDSCTQHCPHGVSVRRLVEVMRQRTMQEHYLAGRDEIFAADHDLAVGVRALGMLGQRVQSFHNVSGEDNAARLAWTANLPHGAVGLDNAPGADMVYFVGCVSAMFPMSYGIPQSFATLLRKAGLRATTLAGQEWCCGYPLLMAGQLAQAHALMAHNIEQVRRSGASEVVMTCPSCYHMWQHVYPSELGKSLGFAVRTASEVLCALLRNGHLRFKDALRTTVVTYHDPCDLGRKGGQYDQPREVLREVPGCTLVEMQNNREHALCCGGGGNLETFAPTMTAEIAARRVAQATQVGASYLLSACPQCVRTLTKAARELKIRLRVLDVVQFVESALAD